MNGGAVPVVGPAGQHVAEVHDEAAWRRDDVVPSAVDVRQLQAGCAVDVQQCDAAVVAVGAAAELVGSRFAHRRVADEPCADEGAHESSIEVGRLLAESLRDQPQQTLRCYEYSSLVCLDRLPESRQGRPLVRPFEGRPVRVVERHLWAEIQGLLEVGSHAGLEQLALDAGVAPVMIGQLDRQRLFVGERLGEELPGHVEHAIEQLARDTVAGDCKEADAPAGRVDLRTHVVRRRAG